MKLKKIKYKIDDRDSGFITVTGYAIDWPTVRICARQLSRDDWCIDHFDSGLRVSAYARTLSKVVLHGIALLEARIASGAYKKAIDDLNKERS